MTLVPPRHPSATLSSALLKGFRQAIAFDTKATSRTAPSARRRLVSATSDISSNTQLDSMRAGAERHRASGGRSVVVEASGPADLPVAATLMPALTPAAVQVSETGPRGRSPERSAEAHFVSPPSPPTGERI
jgi:hypothetical protein